MQVSASRPASIVFLRPSSNASTGESDCDARNDVDDKAILPATGSQSYRNILDNGPTCYHFLPLTYDDQQIEPLPADAVSDTFPVVQAQPVLLRLNARPNAKCERVIAAYLRKLAREETVPRSREEARMARWWMKVLQLRVLRSGMETNWV